MASPQLILLGRQLSSEPAWAPPFGGLSQAGPTGYAPYWQQVEPTSNFVTSFFGPLGSIGNTPV